MHPSLPRTIEGATLRYLNTYETNFQGPLSERARLRDYAEAKIHALRKRAPNFFENKLPEIVNQAASSLLSHDTRNAAGLKAFNDIHADFLRVLDELKKSQPAGNISFQSERDRAIMKEDLRKKHLKIRQKIDELESLEFDADELGEDEADSRYQRTFSQLDSLKQDLKRIVTQIAKMEGQSVDDEVKFQLKVKPRTVLEQLSTAQLAELEEQIAQFLAAKSARREFPDKDIIGSWLVQAGVNTSTLKQQELNDLFKDTSDAIRTFFRERENDRRNEYFESLISNKRLLPKEGIILSGPDDIPDSVREQLELSEKRSQRKLDEYCEQYSKMPCEEDKGCDDLEDELAEDADNEPDLDLDIFKRVKEEPRDDCDLDEASDDEVLVCEEIASDIERTLGHKAKKMKPASSDTYAHAMVSELSDSEGAMDGGDQSVADREDPTQQPEPENIYKAPDTKQLGENLNNLLNSELSATLAKNSQAYQEDDDDDDLECLGIVEPQDKCPTIDLTN